MGPEVWPVRGCAQGEASRPPRSTLDGALTTFVQPAKGMVVSEPAREEVSVDVRTRFGRVQAKVALPATMRLAELAWNALVLDERLVAMATRADALLGNVVACSKGCGACCRQPVPLSAPEAWMLADSGAKPPGGPAGHPAVPLRRSPARAGRGQLRPAIAAPRSEQGAGRDAGARLLRPRHPVSVPGGRGLLHPPEPPEHLPRVSGHHTGGALRRSARPQAASRARAGASLGVPRDPVAEVLGNDVEVIPHVRALDWAAAHAEDGRRTFETRPMFVRLMELVNAVAARPAESR